MRLAPIYRGLAELPHTGTQRGGNEREFLASRRVGMRGRSRQAARAKPENHDTTAVRRWRFTSFAASTGESCGTEPPGLLARGVSLERPLRAIFFARMFTNHLSAGTPAGRPVGQVGTRIYTNLICEYSYALVR
jgi:hypothetical protein